VQGSGICIEDVPVVHPSSVQDLDPGQKLRSRFNIEEVVNVLSQSFRLPIFDGVLWPCVVLHDSEVDYLSTRFLNASAATHGPD
jgi:hypothetical protein